LFVSSFSSCFCAYDQDDPASLYDEAQHDGASPAAALAAKKLADSIQSIRAANPRIFGKSSDSGLPRKSRRPRADVPASDAAYGSGLPRRPRADVPAAPDDVYGSGLPSRSRRPRADGVPAASGAAYGSGFPSEPRAASGGGFDDDVI
jgi:hypothetical protein